MLREISFLLGFSALVFSMVPAADAASATAPAWSGGGAALPVLTAAGAAGAGVSGFAAGGLDGGSATVIVGQEVQ